MITLLNMVPWMGFDFENDCIEIEKLMRDKFYLKPVELYEGYCELNFNTRDKAQDLFN